MMTYSSLRDQIQPARSCPQNPRLENVPTERESDESGAEDGAGELARPVVSISLKVSLVFLFFFLDFGVFISGISGGRVYDQARRVNSLDPDNYHKRLIIGKRTDRTLISRFPFRRKGN